MSTGRYELAAGVLDGTLYALGGFGAPGTGRGVGATVEAYDPAADKWTTKAPMPTARCRLAGGAGNGVLYALGGFEAEGRAQGGALATLDAYDPASDTWTTKMPMPAARWGLAVGVVNGILDAVGGGNPTGFVATVEAYDPATDTWTTKVSMPTARSDLAVGVV